MSKKVVLYPRVSSEAQASEERVSIEQQLADMNKLIERNNWTVLGVFIEKESYIKTRPPYKGMKVNPSGEYDDRPQLLAMLEYIKTRDVDAIVCWRDDRLVRHPRVAVMLEDALDEADKRRIGKAKIEVYDASGAILDRFTLGIKAQLWREENKRRTERVKLGKVGTLQVGRWPGTYQRLGYKCIKEPGKRGVLIVIDEEEVIIVRLIFDLADKGLSINEIREELIAREARQKYNNPCNLLPAKEEPTGRRNRHRWSQTVINEILRCPHYMGKLSWDFDTGPVWIDIPQIIEPEQWHRVQTQIDDRKRIALRNTKGIYALQEILYCECGCKLSVGLTRYYYYKLADGTRKRGEHKASNYSYKCNSAYSYKEEEHGPKRWWGIWLDYSVWKYIADSIIQQPDLVIEQVKARQAELQAQGDSMDGDIARAKQKLEAIDQERSFYQRQAAKGFMTEAEFEARMNETKEAKQYWQTELAHLKELRDNAAKIQDELDYARTLLASIRQRLPKINQTLDELKALPRDQQDKVLTERKQIIQALCKRVTIYRDGQITIDGMVDSKKLSIFEATVTRMSSNISSCSS